METTAKPMTKKQQAAAEKQVAREQLRKLCPRGGTIYCVLRSVSRSGMTRCIDFYAIDTENGGHNYLSGYIATLLGYRRSKKQGIIVEGCGMDMGFKVVYNVAWSIFTRDEVGSDSGYALRSEWL